MKKKGNLLRRIIYKLLSLENYLYVISKLYFISFNTGLLKNNRYIAFPYFLKNIIKHGDVCIDIGANLGYYSVPLSKLVGNTGRIYSVEPVKPILHVLRKNTKNLKNVEILPFALGVENKSISLGNDSVKKDGFIASGSHYVMENNTGKEPETTIEFKAEMRIGSELFANLEQLDFIKCDIEGYEIIVLPELEKIISKFKPAVLVESNGDNRKKIMDLFSGLGYRAFVLDGGLLYKAAEDESWDILFIPDNKLEMFKKYYASA